MFTGGVVICIGIELHQVTYDAVASPIRRKRALVVTNTLLYNRFLNMMGH